MKTYRVERLVSVTRRTVTIVLLAEDEDDAEDQAIGLEPQVDEFVDEETLEVKVKGGEIDAILPEALALRDLARLFGRGSGRGRGSPRRWQESILDCCGGHFMQSLIACTTKPSFFFISLVLIAKVW